MPTLRIEEFVLPSADLGGPSPLPPLRPYTNASSGGFSGTSLPYRTQDGYDRTKKPRGHKVAVLENDKLRAIFMLNLGGRLWSLFDKVAGKELLQANPVFQPANLAIRNAWFSGGVEWNVSLLGHCVFTCSPLFAAEIEGPDGPALRMYEFERIRQAVFEIDFHLPDGSDLLFVRPRITNTLDREVDMYWWSNIAVDETEGTRVLAPTDGAWGHGYDDSGKMGQIDLREIPTRTYSTRAKNAGDVFFAIPPEQRPWEAALDERGEGLLHASTKRLYGRKLFYWGTAPGGAKWQQYLSQPGEAYIEIQAGLARTQGEYVSMPAGATWTWLEAYGSFAVPPAMAHEPDWTSAWKQVDGKVNDRIPYEDLESRLTRYDSHMSPIRRILNQGSGWGALEERRRGTALARGARFEPRSVATSESSWAALLEQNRFPEGSPDDEPGEFMVQPEWVALLRDAIDAGRSDHWLAWYHLGVGLWDAGEREKAEEAWRTSIERAPSAWSHRNLAVAAELRGDVEASTDLIVKAVLLKPTAPNLVHEACAALSGAKRHSQLRDLVAKLPPETKDLPRVRLALAGASLALGNLPAVEAFFETPLEVVDIREGEVSLSEMWFALQVAKAAKAQDGPLGEEEKERIRRECPPPEGFDFRMTD